MIGRGSENDIVVDCASVTLRHAEMVRVEGGYELRDLGSTNGTMIDGTRVGQAALVDGSVILIGTTAITYRTG